MNKKLNLCNTAENEQNISSHDVASGSAKAPCNKIDKSLKDGNILTFSRQKCDFNYYFLIIVTPIVGVCNCSMFCCTLLCVRSSIAIILMGKRELIALLNLSSWCLVMVERLFLAVPQGCLRFVIVVFPDHTHLLFLSNFNVL